MFSIDRQTIIDDDLNAMTRVPTSMGRAARRTIGDKVWEVLTSNPIMSDGTALFDAAHNNLNAGGAAAISTTSVSAGRNAMGLQQDPDNNVTALNIRPAIFAVPYALQDVAQVLMTSQTNPDSGQDNSEVPNTLNGMATVIPEARLSNASATAWYLLASPGIGNLIELGFVEGQNTPFIDSREGWKVDGLEYKVRLDFGVKALDFRYFYKNDGV